MPAFDRKYSLEPKLVPMVQTQHRRIATRIPVPESLPIFERLERHEPLSMQGQPPLVMDRAEGFYVFDKWGNQWLDWSSGVLISNVGNSHPDIVKALQIIIGKPLLSSYVFSHEGRAELAELLAGLAPGPGYKVFLLSTGSEAIENCIKLARTYALQTQGPHKRYVVSFGAGFHGRTMGAQLAGGMPQLKTWLGEPDPTFIQIPFPDGYKNPDTRFALFEETLARAGVKPADVAAVLAESYQGVGPDFFPTDYAQKLEAWCRQHDAILIMDEVQSGFGRTGKWFMFQHYGITPDLIACGKGISSSLPLAAVLGRADVMNRYPPGSMTSTHSASPLPVAAAVANIKALKTGDYIANAARLDSVLRDGLLALQAKYPQGVGCVRSLGLVAGLQMVKPGTREPDAGTALAINTRCFEKGLLMFAPVGVAGECIKLAPPLCITEHALHEGLDVLGQAFAEVVG